MHNTILIVDDDESMRTFLSTLLQGAGYGVVLADSLQAGMKVLEENPVDLLIADVRLGGANELQLIAMSRRFMRDHCNYGVSRSCDRSSRPAVRGDVLAQAIHIRIAAGARGKAVTSVSDPCPAGVRNGGESSQPCVIPRRRYNSFGAAHRCVGGNIDVSAVGISFSLEKFRPFADVEVPIVNSPAWFYDRFRYRFGGDTHV